MPHGLIVCYEMGRSTVFKMEDVPLAPLRRVVEFYTDAANIMHPCRVIGLAVNGAKYATTEVNAECRRVERQFALPACDVIRHGPQKLVEAAIGLRRALRGRRAA
jgi:uncharacterized NAD-dependent epimerase/dehydratase family protein